MSSLSQEVRDEPKGLWTLALSPTIWSVHFLLSYCTAAVWCANVADAGDSLTPVRILIAAYTTAALVAIGFVGWRGWKRHTHGRADAAGETEGSPGTGAPHDVDTPQDRHRFLGFATALLSGLSAVAVVYESLPAMFIGTCR